MADETLEVYEPRYVVGDTVVQLVRERDEFDWVGRFRVLIDDTSAEVPDETCEEYVARARELVLTRRHPYSEDPLSEPWETRYNQLALEIAAAMWWKHGADGQTASRENGIYRAWDAADAYVPSGLLQRIVPIAAVV